MCTLKRAGSTSGGTRSRWKVSQSLLLQCNASVNVWGICLYRQKMVSSVKSLFFHSLSIRVKCLGAVCRCVCVFRCSICSRSTEHLFTHSSESRSLYSINYSHFRSELKGNNMDILKSHISASLNSVHLAQLTCTLMKPFWLIILKNELNLNLSPGCVMWISLLLDFSLWIT